MKPVQQIRAIITKHPEAKIQEIIMFCQMAGDFNEGTIRTQFYSKGKRWQIQEAVKATKVSFDELREASSQMRENNDCAVKAVAAAAGVSYEAAHKALAKQGRRCGRGTSPFMTFAALHGFGKTTEMHPGRSFAPRGRKTFTVSMLARMGSQFEGTWLARVKGHIFAVIDGEIIDWIGEDSRRQIHTMVKVS